MCAICWRGIIELGEWDAAYINSLPDEAFAVIEPAYKRGETKNKNARHLPHHSKEVKNGRDSKDHIDLAHLRNARARMSQIKPVTGSISVEDLRSRAKSHLDKHAKDLGIGGEGEEQDRSKSADSRLKAGGTIHYLPPSWFVPLSMTEAKVDLSADIGTIKLVQPGASSETYPPLSRESFMAQLQQRIHSLQSQDQGLKPDHEAYIDFPVRALSKILISSLWLDVSQGNVLQRSAPLLKGRTVFPDHNVNIENWLGVVLDSAWNGKASPPGIDAQVRVHPYANPKIAMGLLTDPPAINRVSVTFWFQWKKSHDMEDDNFWRMLGREVDDEIVRIIVTEIEDYGELSLVWFGADPGAKRID